ncbi:MAG: NAD(P)-binding domain-containing protein [Gemmatimonadales bacterium]
MRSALKTRLGPSKNWLRASRRCWTLIGLRRLVYDTQWDLVVIGCGPTGIAALHHGAAAGLSVVGVEAGATPFHRVQGYLERLVLASEARELEIGGFPLDCRGPRAVTREDLIHYCSRIVNRGKLRILTGCRCEALVPHSSGVTVVGSREGEPIKLEARNVIVTSWFEPAPPPRELCAAQVPIYSGFCNGDFLANRRVLVVGGGQSAFEHAVTLMLQGQQVCLLSRSPAQAVHRGSDFERLLRATRSRVRFGVRRLAAQPHAVTFECDGGHESFACDAIVACVGERPSQGTLGMLVTAGVLDPELRRRIVCADGPSRVSRRKPWLSRTEATRIAVAEWPDLWPYLFEGRKRVQFAGGVLHVGGGRTGTMVSILSARLAIGALTGGAVPSQFVPPLPDALDRWARQAWLQPSGRWADRDAVEGVLALRPIRIVAAHRRWPVGVEFARDRLGSAAGFGDGESANHVARQQMPAAIESVPTELRRAAMFAVAFADGGLSVAAILARATECGEDPGRVCRALDWLWQNNVLTWYPPAGTVPGQWGP